MSNKKISTSKNLSTEKDIKNIQKFINERISNIKAKIENIDSQLLYLESILNDLNKKIHSDDFTNQNTSKAVTKSRLIRWYLEDLKIYDELNNIRIKYEELLSKYTDQLLTSNFKLEDLRIKLEKVETDNNQLQILYEELERKLQNVEPQIIAGEQEEIFDEQFKL